ncbi:sialate O-acetylesterase [Pseudomonas sp.]|uniref:sialate O-acetylesterase n=1 Tax=Pseudomonas sp. TaxID=306 RepID=UPI0019E0ABAC|nr:sialate O-acetylesterase [Pseudomonas sp.]MBF0676254.1 hypothetical protein [Pseudomonas sp.]
MRVHTHRRTYLIVIAALLSSNLIAWLLVFKGPLLHTLVAKFRPDSARITDTRHRRPVEERDVHAFGIFLTYGQSNSVNAGQIGYVPGPQVLNFYQGRLYRYEDPALGGQGRQGSVWGRLGDRLVSDNIYPGAIFALAGAHGKTVRQLSEGPDYQYFLEQYRGLRETFGRVDAILFHQGEANHRHKQAGHYERQFLVFYRKLRADGVTAPIYLSQASLCNNARDEHLLAQQDKLIADLPGVLRGPNSDALAHPRYRLPDRCHFSAEGLDALSQLWFESLSNAQEE